MTEHPETDDEKEPNVVNEGDEVPSIINVTVL